MKNWSHYSWEKILTADGSYSLKSLVSNSESHESEIMHHRGGAHSETFLVYGRILEPLFAAHKNPRFLSLGLGLGYIELLVAQKAFELGREDDFYLVSYESCPELVEYFLSEIEKSLHGNQASKTNLWVTNSDQTEAQAPALTQTLIDEALIDQTHADQTQINEISQTYENVFSFYPDQVKQILFKAYQQKRWVIYPALTQVTVVPFLIHGFLWDAFSRKTTPELWDEDFLKSFISQSLDKIALPIGFTTYACNGPIKRALRACGFDVQEQKGFHGKRQSLMAWLK